MTLHRAEITQFYNDVKVIGPSGAHPAAVQEVIEDGRGVRTGLDSRAELLFQDKSVTRLGANTLFNFDPGTRKMECRSGTMLLQVPKNIGGATIRTAAVTAAITGTTILLEYSPDVNPPPGSGKKKRHGYVKVIVLEGTLRLYLNDRLGESTLITPGKMIILPPDAFSIPDPVDVDIDRLIETSFLINNRYWNRADSQFSLDPVRPEITKQEKSLGSGNLRQTNALILGKGTSVIIATADLLNNLDRRFNAENPFRPSPSPSPGASPAPTQTQAVSTPTPKPTPGLITSPNPYVVQGGTNPTVIVTEPSITTAGVTELGFLYPGPKAGTASDFLFGPTGQQEHLFFLNGFNQHIASLNAPLAVFKFSSLVFTGAPLIDTTNGTSDLALVSDNGISGDLFSSPGQGLRPRIRGDLLSGAGHSIPASLQKLTYLLLATKNGPIHLISNSPFPLQPNTLEIDLLARGHNGDVILDTPIGAGVFNVAAENTIQFNNYVNAGVIRGLSLGDTIFGPNASLSAPTIDLRSAGNIILNQGNFDIPTLTSLTVNATKVSLSSNFSFGPTVPVSINAGIGGFDTQGFNIFATSDGLVQGLLELSVAGGSFSGNAVTADNVTIQNGSFTTTSDVLVNNLTAGQINVTGNLTAANQILGSGINVTGNIQALSVITNGGDILASNINGNTNAQGNITVTNRLFGTSAIASGNISAGTLGVETVSTPGNVVIGAGGITNRSFTNNLIADPAAFSISANTVSSQGGINFVGTAQTDSQNGLPGNGGTLSLTINSLVLNPTAVGAISSANLNGADAVSGVTAGGNGGTLNVFSNFGPITINAPIDATTGGQFRNEFARRGWRQREFVFLL